MPKYKCKNCGYQGKKLIFQFNDYSYCVATNEKETKFITSNLPEWAKGRGDAEIGEPVGCPRCHSWGVENFEIIKKKNKKI